MNRLYCLFTAALTFCLTSTLVEHSTRGLTPGEMGALRGGNAESGKYNQPCDVLVGLYVGCTGAGAACSQCASADQNGAPVVTMADYLGQASLPNHPGGFKFSQNTQDCGDLWTGTCVVEPASPTGFKCVMADTGNACSLGVYAVIPQ